MVAKLITWDVDREHATRRMIRALGEYEIEGLTTLIPFHETILATEQWARGETCRDLLEDPDWIKSLPDGDSASRRASDAGDDEEEADREREYKVEVAGRLYPVKVIGAALAANGAAPDRRSARRSASARPAAPRPPATTSSRRCRAASSRSRSPRATRSRRARCSSSSRR